MQQHLKRLLSVLLLVTPNITYTAKRERPPQVNTFCFSFHGGPLTIIFYIVSYPSIFPLDLVNTEHPFSYLQVLRALLITLLRFCLSICLII